MHSRNHLPTILIVEDDPFDVSLLTNSLAAVGADHPVVVCVDGREAVAWLGQTVKNEVAAPSLIPCLMLVDLCLPHIDGFTVIGWVRGQRLFAPMTIAVVSGSQEPGDVKRAFAAGADHVISKPADVDTLRGLLEDTGLIYSSAADDRSGQ